MYMVITGRYIHSALCACSIHNTHHTNHLALKKKKKKKKSFNKEKKAKLGRHNAP
jgi:hypothetical protein